MRRAGNRKGKLAEMSKAPAVALEVLYSSWYLGKNSLALDSRSRQPLILTSRLVTLPLDLKSKSQSQATSVVSVSAQSFAGVS